MDAQERFAALMVAEGLRQMIAWMEDVVYEYACMHQMDPKDEQRARNDLENAKAVLKTWQAVQKSPVSVETE